MTKKSMSAPAVMRDTNHPSTVDAVFDSDRNERNGNAIVTVKAAHGTPFFVVLVRKLGARPSRARPYSDLVAQYVRVLPAENIDVIKSAFTRCGRPLTPRFSIAMT